jgi:hypothetical protein
MRHTNDSGRLLSPALDTNAGMVLAVHQTPALGTEKTSMKTVRSGSVLTAGRNGNLLERLLAAFPEEE